MTLNHLVNRILEDNSDYFKELLASREKQNLSLRKSARLPISAGLSYLNRNISFLITDKTDRALILEDELKLWAPDIQTLIFPEPTSLFYVNEPWGISARRDRIRVLSILGNQSVPGTTKIEKPLIVISPVRALMTRTLPRRLFLKSSKTLKRNQNHNFEDLLKFLVRIGYESSSIVITPGQFVKRGGILDIWPVADEYPVRIEFFGNQVDTIRDFDPVSQRSITSQSKTRTKDRVNISPAKEYILPPEIYDQDEDGGETVRKWSEFHIPVLNQSITGVLDYLSDQSIILIDDTQDFSDTIDDLEREAVNLRRDLIDSERLDEDYPRPYLTWEEIQDSLDDHKVIGLGPFTEETPSRDTISKRFIPAPRFAGQLKPFIQHLRSLMNNERDVTVISRQRNRLEGIYYENANFEIDDQYPTFVDGNLTEGWIYQSTKFDEIHLLSDSEIFGWRRPERRSRVSPITEAPESRYDDLKSDDWVVHIEHGIGRYKGLVQRTIDGSEREFLCVEYAGDAELYVPVYQADRITRYIGPDRITPRTSRLGSVGWKSAKEAVKKAVQDIAIDLLDLYAKRKVIEGYSFSQDTAWQEELEASFPYIETNDQIKVLKEVKIDMESSKPMDRLICGDVGYGKTEIALRAAFKAIMDGKQVAVLVPTTVLAQQHFNTFRERLSSFPVNVEMLSRFRSAKQQDEILKDLKSGSVDIVIGTHRLLSNDVDFNDLGMLVIDEEQRFGVTHKEKLKQLRTQMDVMTMTATPIPRTLYMALTGIRDISMITTPPEERLPIITHVGPYSPRLVKLAIIRELERGGQVFFVHNRVQTIQAMESHIKNIFPTARIAIAHGQMKEADLSTRMNQFSNGEVDILLTTSIIESGLDIPNANTLIVDRADIFGLSQLYQLKGRVGRGAQRAYAYFFRHRRIPPTIEGKQRLETISENTQLGAGFNISMRDLEIRGAGDILGTQQHGYIAMVGFHLYTKMLAGEVKKILKNQEIEKPQFALGIESRFITVEVDLPWDVSIPNEYIPNRQMRLSLYRRMANIFDISELDALQEEMTDRFGKVPVQAQNLLEQIRIKLLADKSDITAVVVIGDQIVIRFEGGEVPDDLPEIPKLIRIGRNALWFPYTRITEWFPILVKLLEDLKEHYSEQDEEK